MYECSAAEDSECQFCGCMECEGEEDVAESGEQNIEADTGSTRVYSSGDMSATADIYGESEASTVE